MQILNILLLIFSADQSKCDSLNGDLYNFSRKLSEVEFCQCVSRESFDKLPVPDFCYYENHCSGHDVDELKKRYKKIKKELR